MFAKLLSRRRSNKFRQVARREFFVEPLEDRRLLAVSPGEFVCIEFDTELLEMDLTGPPVPIPVGSDPGNTNFPDTGGGTAADGGLASDSGYAYVDSAVTITLSSQRNPDPGPASLGKAFAFLGGQAGDNGLVGNGECGGEINPEELHGEQFIVDSFFDVFFDITVTDVDSRPGRDFAGQPDGATIVLQDNQAEDMESRAFVVFDKDLPNFGLIPPPETAPYIGHFQIVIPLGGDINGNGEDDVLKFTLVSHAAGDENRTFIQLPDGTVIDEFNSKADLDGLIQDESTDPPFTIVLTGPTTASSMLLNPVAPQKDPGFSYVDANNNQLFDAGTDVALVQGEVENGFFDTLIPEGGYTSIILGAGLVINDGPISARNITYRADGNLVINTDLNAKDDIFLTSRRRNVRLDDPTLTAGDDIYLWALKDITSTDDVIRATGVDSRIQMWAGRDVALQGTVVEAKKGRADIWVFARRNAAATGCVLGAGRHLTITALKNIDGSGSALAAGANVTLRAHGNAVASGSSLNAGTNLTVWALGNVDISGSILQAGTTVTVWARRNVDASGSFLDGDKTVAVRAHRHIDVSSSILDGGRNVVLSSLFHQIDASSSSLMAGWRIYAWAKWRVNENDSTVQADREVELRSARGNIFAMDALLTSLGSPNGEVELDAGLDVVVKRSRIEAKRKITLRARDDIFAREATLLACGNRGRVDIRAPQKVSLWSATVRAYEKIDIWSYLGDVDARRASIAIRNGSTSGDIWIWGGKIRVQAAEIVGPDKVQLNGTKVGAPAFIGAGTRPCP
jgi:hypothetical protein